MLVRIVVLLLAVFMMAGNAPTAAASLDITSMADELQDPDLALPPILPARITAIPPDRKECARTHASPSPSCGRVHAAFVFRPPRLVASR